MYLVVSQEVLDSAERPNGDEIYTRVLDKQDAQDLVRDLERRPSVLWVKLIGKVK